MDNDYIKVKDVRLTLAQQKLQVVLSDNINNSKKVQESIVDLLSAYLDTLKAFNYDADSTDRIKPHIISLLILLKNIKAI